MADLFILLPANPDETPLFAWRSGGDWVVDDERPAGRFGRGESAVAFVPGTGVTSFKADILTRKPAEARRTALFAVEDDLAQPVEQLHVALGPAGETGARIFQIASLQDMRAWTGLLQRHGLPEADLVASHELLPAGNIAVDAGREILFRQGEHTYACDSDVPDDFIKSVAADSLDAVHGENLALRLGQSSTDQGFDPDQHLLPKLAEWYTEKTPSAHISLRQGDFGVKRSLELKGIERWRMVGAMAGLAIVLWMGTVWMETSALEREATELRSRTQAIVTSFVPSANGNVSTAIASLQQSQRDASSSLRPTTATAALYDAVAPTR
ncbi:MAG: type II secretion system protein GspL, partial [Henriciella sp.]|uniref:type II secretion system protein GspL n=1 Tax=Henriciella sp. TaxID=1968823 RepID=UPI003C7468DB